MMQVEDVMLIDESKLVSLEYIFYQTDAKYSNIVPGDYRTNPLGQLIEGDANKNASYQKTYHPKYFRDAGNDYLNDHASSHAMSQIIMRKSASVGTPGAGVEMDATPGLRRGATVLSDSAKGEARVEALLCVWVIDQGGQLMKDKEISFDYCKARSARSKVKMHLSNDQRYIVLPIFDAAVNYDV